MLNAKLPGIDMKASMNNPALMSMALNIHLASGVRPALGRSGRGAGAAAAAGAGKQLVSPAGESPPRKPAPEAPSFAPTTTR
jgi:hypothetical protein